jgi:hypothetical protein
MPLTDFPFMPFFEKMLRKTNARLEIMAPINPDMRGNSEC